jgi:hypothetical protein
VQLRGRHDVGSSSLDQWRGQRRDLADPSGHDRAIEIDAVARVDAGLTIERKMIAIFADQDVRQKPGARKAALDRQRRHRALRHALTAPAGERRSDVLDHFEVPGNVIENLGDILADLAHLAAAGRAGAARLMHDFAAWQMRRQCPASGLLAVRR